MLYKWNIYFFVLWIFMEMCWADEVGSSCDNGKGECSYLSNCAIYRNYLDTIGDKIRFCNAHGLVCCPKKINPLATSYISKDDEQYVSVRECKKYQSDLYKPCLPTETIVGGTKAMPKEFPHAALLGEKSVSRYSWLCGGTLISPKFVLTAAHCFQFDINVVRLGELDHNTTTDNTQTQEFGILQFIPHPKYEVRKQYFDLALIELNGTAVFNQFVAPACLPLTNGTEFSKFTAVGWGATKFASEHYSSHLLKVSLERFEDNKCFELIEKKPSLMDGFTEHVQLCAGSYTAELDTCNGDSGGPLFVEHPTYNCMYLLIGVTSFGEGCGKPGRPGVYTRVNLYVDWIERVVWNTTTFV